MPNLVSFFEAVLEFDLLKYKTHYVFHRHTNSGYIILVVCVYYNYRWWFWGDCKVENLHSSPISTKNLVKLKYFSAIKVARSKQGIWLSQRKYVFDMLEEVGLLGGRPIEVLMDLNHKLLMNDSALFENPGPYHRLVGKLNFLTVTRLYIAYAVSVVSQFMGCLRIPHWDVVICVLRFCKRAPRLELLYRAKVTLE